MRTSQLSKILWTALAIASLSCTSTRLTSSWSDPVYENRPLKSVLVLGVANNQEARRLYEDTFVAQLKMDHIEAVAGHIPLPSSETPDRAAIEAAIKDAGVSTVLITRVLAVQKRSRKNSPTARSEPAPHSGNMYGYYFRSIDDVSSPGYATSYEVHKLASNLYDSTTGTLIWSAQTETIDPDNIAKEIDALVRILIDDLRQKKLL